MARLRVLVADDDAVTRAVVAAILRKGEFDVQTAADGEQAWHALEQPEAPAVAVLDWMMPGLDGPEICRRLRAEQALAPIYIVLLTARESAEDVMAGLRAGADDYVTKPPGEDELLARVKVGARVVQLQRMLGEHRRRLDAARAEITDLQRLLPMCSRCKRVRDGREYWQQVESYLAAHHDARAQSFCPECFEHHLRPETVDTVTPEQVLDPQVIEGLRQLNQAGEPDVLREVLSLFLADAPERLAAIDRAVVAGSGPPVQRAAHAFKGVAAAIGATELQRLCREVEEAGREGALTGVQARLAAVRAEYARVRAAIEQLL